MNFSTSHHAPDYSSPMPVGGKKPKMKKVHPQITLRNIPKAIHAKMQTGKKIKAHVTLMPLSKGEGASGPYGDDEGDPEANHVTMEMHSMDPEMGTEPEEQPKTAGQALQEFMAKKKSSA